MIFGSLPSLSSIPAFVDTPINVPIVSNISTNKNANITTTNSNVAILSNSSLNKTGPILGMLNPFEKSGNTLKKPSAGFGTYKPVT